MIEPIYIENVKQKKADYQTEPNEKSLYALLCALIRCGEQYAYLNELEAAKSTYKEATEYAGKSEYLKTSIPMQRELVDCYLKIGDICKEQNDTATASAFYEQGMKLWETVVDPSGTLADRRVFCICCEKAAGAFDSQNRPDEAKACLEKSLMVRKQIVAEDPIDYDRRMLATVYDSLGIHYELRKDRRAANDCYKEGLRLCQQLVNASDTYQNRELLAYAYYNTAATSEQRLERKDFFQKAYELFERLNAERPCVGKYREALAVIRAKLLPCSLIEE